MQTDADRAARTLGVIDIGSNSGRVIAARVSGATHLDVLGDARSPLRLVRDVSRDGRLSDATIQRTVGIVRGFQAVALGAGAEHTRAIATAAVREAANADAFIRRIAEELGLPVEIANGEQEARFGFLGAVHGLPLEHGIVLDVGGGSLQLVHFRERRLWHAWSLPLGALRLSDRYLRSDPPSKSDMRALKEHVYSRLESAGVPPLLADERLVGTGGTVRNLAKVDRRNQPDYPISRLHGYVLDRRRVDDTAATLAGASASNRARLPGLNGDRSDSIVGGALVVQAVMDRLLAGELQVAGYGMREGVILNSVTQEPASVAAVREAAVVAFGAHFTTWDAVEAAGRARVAAGLLATLQPGMPDELLQAADVAARLLDIGRSVDYYQRHAHAARMVADANLDGFSHRVLALVAATLLAAGERDANTRAYAPLLGSADQPNVEKLAATLALTEALVRHAEADLTSLGAALERRNGHVAVATPVLDTWPLEAPARRVERAFGVGLTFQESASVA